MNPTMKALYDLQQVDTKIGRLRKDHASLDTGARTKQELEEARSELARDQEALKKASASLKDTELELQGVESKKKELEKNLYGGKVRNPKELTTIEQEIESLKHRQDRLEEIILEHMESVEKAKAAAAQKEAVASAKEKEHRETVANYQKETGRMRGVLQQLSAERARRVATLDAEALRRYEAMKAKSGDLAVAAATDNTCEGCRMAQSAAVMRHLKQGDAYIACQNCGRYLYFEEEGASD
ncbi:MAG: hypothetical protein IT210_06870 [Armatimonadetes bacterium]|nr:hypothetical protein [Armatimonadota bacterium]